MTTPNNNLNITTQIGMALAALGWMGLMFTKHDNRNVQGHAIVFHGVYLSFLGNILEDSVPTFLSNTFKVLARGVITIGSLLILESAIYSQGNAHLPYALTAMVAGILTVLIAKTAENSTQPALTEPPVENGLPTEPPVKAANQPT